MRQIERDEKVRLLVAIVERTYAFVVDAHPIERVQNQALILEQISLQTFECARFIVRYATDTTSFCKLSPLSMGLCPTPPLLGERAIKGVGSSKDATIDKFMSTFEVLLTQLDRTVNVNAQITLFRVMDQVERIGMSAVARFLSDMS